MPAAGASKVFQFLDVEVQRRPCYFFVREARSSVVNYDQRQSQRWPPSWPPPLTLATPYSRATVGTMNFYTHQSTSRKHLEHTDNSKWDSAGPSVLGRLLFYAGHAHTRSPRPACQPPVCSVHHLSYQNSHTNSKTTLSTLASASSLLPSLAVFPDPNISTQAHLCPLKRKRYTWRYVRHDHLRLRFSIECETPNCRTSVRASGGCLANIHAHAVPPSALPRASVRVRPLLLVSAGYSRGKR